MKTLIVYDTRHGFTEKCVGLLAGELAAGVELWSLRQRPGSPDWSRYDAIVFGGPVYFGRWSKRLVRFLHQHQSSLVDSGRLLGAFVVSLSPRAAALRYFSKGLPVSLKGKLGHVSCFGGGIVWNELTWWERLVLKRRQSIQTDASNLSLPEIQALAAWLSAKAAP